MCEVSPDEQSRPQIDALPAAALPFFAELCAALELAPWNGSPINEAFPDAPVRTLVFGPHHQGPVTYLVLDELRRVDIAQGPVARLTDRPAGNRAMIATVGSLQVSGLCA